MVFYFTATGNSLYIAKKFIDRPFSIPQVIWSSKRVFSDDMIGIVCPVFAGQPPQMVIRFLEKFDFQTKYFYIILTYGLDHSDSPEYTAKIAKKCGVHVDYITTIKMVDNYLPIFDMNEEKGMEKHVEEQVAKAIQAVSERKINIPEATKEERELHARVAEMNRQTPAFNDGSQITVKNTCIGCGTCEKVCPEGNFYIENGKAKRKKVLAVFVWPVHKIVLRKPSDFQWPIKILRRVIGILIFLCKKLWKQMSRIGGFYKIGKYDTFDSWTQQ